MPTQRTHRILTGLTTLLGAATLSIVVYAFGSASGSGQLSGRLVPNHLRSDINQEWVHIREDEVREGRSIPAHRNVIFQIPEEVERISRHTLLGRTGTRVRYWGGCDDPSGEAGRRDPAMGFLMTLFLSEKEREVRREEQLRRRRKRISILDHIRSGDLNEERVSRGRIRHQQEIFVGGHICYIQTEEPIPIGTDQDGDGANSAVERFFGSDPKNPDSDRDGIIDGLEIFRLGTHPKRRDSDGDGLLDGIEDRNRNGKWDNDETNPNEWDTDSDGLCDGLCKVNRGRELRGEDKNLNGKFEPESGEYNPLRRDTDGDDIGDLTEYLNCIAAEGANC